MNKVLKKLISVIMAVVLTATASFSNADATPYSGLYNYSGMWFERTGFLWLLTDVYDYQASYSGSFVVLLKNLSGTKYWGNYKNQNKTAQSMTIGVSVDTTVAESSAWTVSAEVGFPIPVKVKNISAKIGGSYSKSKTYSKTLGTSSAYVIDTNSKNGYYAVTHAANCDSYNVTLNKNASFYSSGEIIRFAGSEGYEKLWYKTSYFT